jgi:hypothetical protein
MKKRGGREFQQCDSIVKKASVRRQIQICEQTFSASMRVKKSSRVHGMKGILFFSVALEGF